MRTSATRAGPLLALVLVASACGTASPASGRGGSAGYEAPDRHEPAARAATPAPAPLARAPAFSITTLEGLSVAVPDPKGPTILFFMAGWCLPCLRAAAELDDLHRTYADRGLRVLALDVDPTEGSADLARFRELAGSPRYFWALDQDQRVTRAYQIRSLDATILVSERGEVLFRSESLPNFDTLRRAVQLALAP